MQDVSELEHIKIQVGANLHWHSISLTLWLPAALAIWDIAQSMHVQEKGL